MLSAFKRILISKIISLNLFIEEFNREFKIYRRIQIYYQYRSGILTQIRFWAGGHSEIYDNDMRHKNNINCHINDVIIA